MKPFKNYLRYLHGSNKILHLSIYLLFYYTSLALVTSIWSVYINGLVSNDAYVGMTVSFLSLLSFLSFFVIIPIIERSNKFVLSYVSVLLIGLLYVLYSLNSNYFIFVVLASLGVFLTSIRISSMGLIIEKNSKREDLSKNEGIVYSILNFAYLVGPLISFYIIYKAGINFVFLVSALLIFISLFFLKRSHVNSSGIKKKVDINPFKNFFDFFRKKDRVVSYIIGAGVNFWWALILIYMPLYIIKSFPEYYVGVFISASVVPLILFEYTFSKKAGEYGYRKFFVIGFFMASLTALFSFLLFSPWVVFPLMILSSFFLAMIEPTSEAYFFDISKGKEDQRFYPPYNTAINTGAFIGNVIPAFVLWFFDFRYIFLVFFLGALFLSIISFSTRRVIEKRRKGNF